MSVNAPRRRLAGGPCILWFPVLHSSDLGEVCIVFPADRHPPEPSPASLTEMLFHPTLFPLQGPEREWELEAFPLSGLAPGAFLVMVLEWALSLELSLELAFPVSLSSI